MRVAMYYNNRDVRLQHVPVPKIGSGELLVRIRASGICGSDLMEWYRVKKAPLVLGHEIAGEVVERGEGVSGFELGDRVFASSRALRQVPLLHGGPSIGLRYASD